MNSIPSAADLELELSKALDRHLAKKDGATPANLAESIRYSLLGPGKRIRPRLVLTTAEMLGLKREAALSAALALEMIHCFTLIHDDLPCMDDDDFRRGRPSNHKKFGEAVALLAGDGLIALAIDTLMDAEVHVTPTQLLAATRRMSWAMGTRGVIGGQAAESLLNDKSTAQDLRQMHAMKTGALFSAALLLPSDLSGIDPASSKGKALASFAAELGLAFQVADDLEDAAEEKTDPTSILNYMTLEAALKDTLARLDRAEKELKKEFAEKSGGLIAICEEVRKKLRGAS